MGRQISDHWWRVRSEDEATATYESPCCHRGTDGSGELCGRNHWEHRQGVGEWMEPAHWWLPDRRGRCARCTHVLRHSTHILTGYRPDLRCYRSRWARRLKNWRYP